MFESARVITGRLAVVWVIGPDAVSFLDGLLSQSIGPMTVGATGRSLLLAPNGKLRGVLYVLRGADRVGLVGDAGNAENVATDLRRFKIRVDAEVVVDESPVSELWGGDLSTYDAPGLGEWVETDGSIRFRMPFLHSVVDRLVIVGKIGIEPAGSGERIEARRIELGEPVFGVDIDDKTIAQEVVDVGEFVDFTKGCYLGQELVARIDSRGHVNRRLAGLVIAGSSPPPSGAEVMVEDRSIGQVTSAAFSTRLDAVVALAMLRNDTDITESATVQGVAAKIVDLPIVS